MTLRAFLLLSRCWLPALLSLGGSSQAATSFLPLAPADAVRLSVVLPGGARHALRHVVSGQCVNGLRLGNCSTGFNVVEVGWHVFALDDMASGRWLQVQGTAVSLQAPDAVAAQRFHLDRTAGNRFAFINAATGTCLAVLGDALQAQPCEDSAAQQFELLPLNAGRAGFANGAYLLRDAAGRQPAERVEIVADVAGSYRVVSASGEPAVYEAHRWLIQPAAGGAVVLKSLDRGRCLRSGAARVAACSGRPDQQWRLTIARDEAAPLGPNVRVFSPAQPASAVQAEVDAVFKRQDANHFGPERRALLFKPGRYAVDVHVGFFTGVAGLGFLPDDATILGTVEANAQWFKGNATQNFWRGVENLGIHPGEKPLRWAVSQGTAFRRVHVHGGMVLDDGGWSSGGFLADSWVEGTVDSGSQQQWLTRNSAIGGWKGASWNMVFVGTPGAPDGATWPNPAYTTIERTPVVREKPFLVWTGKQFGVFVPALRRDVAEPTWTIANLQGTTLPLTRFHVAQPERDTAATLNAALASGKHLLFTPGVYMLDAPLNVTRPDTILLGLAQATLLASHGQALLQVADVGGVKIAGLLLDAGAENSPVLLRMGTDGARADHAANPSSLHDLYVRLGGAAVGRATTSMQIDSRHVIGDNLWLWRADHGKGVGWGENTAAHGLVVNGDDVTMYGLFVEHYQDYQVLWRGNGGRTYFYQSELPYDPPSQAAWSVGGKPGYASYKVADEVSTHEAWGLGVYCYFSTDKTVKAGSAIEAPDRPGIKLRRMTALSLGGVGEIVHVLNDRGPSTRGSEGNNARLAE